MKFAEIAVPVPVYQTYAYLIPPDLAASIRPGYRVIVPLVKRKITGYVVSLTDKCDRTDLKTIYDLLDDSPALSTDMLTFAKWIAEYYICPLGEVIKAMLPGGINLESNIFVKLLKDATTVQNYVEENHIPTQEKILNLLLENREMTIQHIRKKIHRSSLNFSITKLVEAGFVYREVILSKAPTRPKFENWIKLSPGYTEGSTINEIIDELSQSAPLQASCLKIVYEHEDISQPKMGHKRPCSL